MAISGFAALVAWGLDQNDWTQAQLAHRLDIRQQTVSRWLTAPQVQPRWDVVIRLAELLGVDLDVVVRALADDSFDPSIAGRAPGPASTEVRDRVYSADLATRLWREGPRFPKIRMSEALSGSRILITGGAGWIGSNLAARLTGRFSPERVLVVDRNGSVIEKADELGDTAEPKLADIDHRDKIFRTIDELQPEIVFHVAGYPMASALERSPSEAVRGHLCGLWHVLEASCAASVPRLVTVSSPKAANPIDVKGQTKYLAERLVAEVNRPGYCSVRFGSLIDSPNGEVERLRAVIRARGAKARSPIGIRCFLRTEHAIDALLTAATVACKAAVVALPFGLRADIYDVARVLATTDQPNLQCAQIDMPTESQDITGPTERVIATAALNPLVAITGSRTVPFTSLECGQGRALKEEAERGNDQEVRRILNELMEPLDDGRHQTRDV